MTLSQKAALRLSEIRQRLNAIGLLEGDAYSEAIRTEEAGLQGEHKQAEVRYRSALIAEGDDEAAMRREFNGESAEGRELRALCGRASVGTIIDCASAQRATSGPEAEVQQHFTVGANMVPLALLQGQAEERAVTPAPADVGASQAPIVPYVFPRSASAFLGVSTPTVPMGERAYNVLTTAAAVRTPAKSADAADTTGAFSSTVLSPKRLQAEFFAAREDLAGFAGMEAALRMNLSEALSDGLDKAILAQLASDLTNPTDPTAAASFGLYRQALYADVDGRYASGPADVRWVVNADIVQNASGLYRTTQSTESALDMVQRASAGVRVSSNMPAKASNVSRIYAAKAGGRGQNAVAPVWSGVEVVRDPYSKLTAGQIRLVAIMLYSAKVLRTAGFAWREFKTS